MAEIKDFSRMCKNYSYCGCNPDCPFLKETDKLLDVSDCVDYMMQHPKEADRIITEWCKEHPQKTYAQDFLEKFPNAPSCNGIPYASACDIYRFSNDHCNKMDVDCKKCWNEVMPDA